MFSNRLLVVGVAAGCVAAAGAGGYLATRQNLSSVAVPAALTSSAPASDRAAAGPAAPGNNDADLAGTDRAATPRDALAAPPRETPRELERTARAAARPTAPRQPDSRASAAARAEQASVDRPASAPSASTQTSPVPMPVEPAASAPELEARGIDMAKTVDVPARAFDELVVPSDSVMGLRTENLVSSERARVEDRVEARVARDVRVNGAVAIPEGTRVLGTVVVAERGGRFKERARIGVRFETLVLANGERIPISTDTIYRYGEAPGNGSAAKIGGGAVAGAILGAIIGGGKGAAVGATTGAGAGTAVVMGSDRSTAAFPPGSEVTARILEPITITIERE